ALRHWILAVAVVCIAALPLVTLVVPTWQIPVAATTASSAAAPSSSTLSVTIVAQRDAQRAVDQPPTPAPPRLAGLLARLPLLLWLGGVVISGCVLVAGLFRLRAIAGAATRLNTGRWVDLVSEFARAAGIHRPVVLLHSSDPTLLVTWGMARPKIVLPLVARDWDEDRTRIVLQHELAHIGRGDWLVQVVAQVVLALNW